MAVTKIKKIEILGLKKDKEAILSLLQKLGMIELINVEQKQEQAAIPSPYTQVNLIEVDEAISYLATYLEKSSPLEGLIRPKTIIYQKELKEVIESFDHINFMKQLSILRNSLKTIYQHQEKLKDEKLFLNPWRNLSLYLDEIRSTGNSNILLGTLRAVDYKNLTDDCKKQNVSLFLEIVNQDKTTAYITLIYLEKDFERLENILKEYHFNFVALGRHKGTVKDRILEINRELMVLDDQITETKEKISTLSRERFKLMVLYDYHANLENIAQADKNANLQQFTFVLKGWIKEKDVSFVEKSISGKFNDTAIFILEPIDNEDVPIDLNNNYFFQPFEFITKIYGVPKYGEIDPTPYLAPFFFLYVGLCISDVGYGLLVVIICSIVLKKLRLGPQGLRFFRLFLFCGISTIIVGALTGSWFGNLIDIIYENNAAFLPLKKFKDSLIILDPLKEPTKLLGIALTIGIIQVWFGNIVAAIGNIKNRRYLDILFDQVTTLVFLFGLTGIGLIFLKLMNQTNINLFKYAALLGAIALIITQGRSEKTIGSKIFTGIFTLYNATSGYLSDILSYSRLWALGLVTGVMANTINLISMQFSQIFVNVVPFANKVFFIKMFFSTLILIIIFVLGHAVSFLMNLLGAFVHPVRLQFVEFFSKFFKGGGIHFKPFKTESKYVNIA